MKLAKALILIATAVAVILLAVLGSYRVASFGGFVGPAGIGLVIALNALEAGRDLRRANKKLLTEQEKRYAETDARDAARRRDLEDKTRAAQLMLDNLSLGQRDFLKRYPLGSGTPLQQLIQMSSEYGLPVETRMLKAVSLPPLNIAPPVTVPPQEKEPERLAEAEDEYVPEGTADLHAMLHEMIIEQVRTARRTQWASGRKREWRVSPEWKAEVDRAYPRSYDPGRRGLFGYPVIVDEQYGPPDLVAL